MAARDAGRLHHARGPRPDRHGAGRTHFLLARDGFRRTWCWRRRLRLQLKDFVMKKTLSKILPVLLAGMLQVAPVLKNVLMQAREMAPCAWAVVLRVGAGAIGVFGF